MSLYSLSGRMKKLDVAENEWRNRLEVGTILYFNGYEDDRYVIIKNLGINDQFSYYGANYEAINLRSKTVSRFQASSLKLIDEKKDDRIQVYITRDKLGADEILDLIKEKEAAAVAAAEQAKIKEIQKATERKELLEKYANLEKASESKKSGAALGAANIRRELKEAFKGKKFSVRSEYYSMGCSIQAAAKDYLDDVEQEQFKKILAKYQYGNFNGMEDIYEYADEQFTDLFGGAKYVFGESNNNCLI